MHVQATATSIEQHKTIAGRRSEKICLCIGLPGCWKLPRKLRRPLRRRSATLVPISVVSFRLLLSGYTKRLHVKSNRRYHHL